MAIAFRDSSTLVETAASVGARTISMPAALADNDFVLIFVHDNLTGNPTATVTPSGFTTGLRVVDGGLTTEVYYKYVTSVAGESAWQVQYGASSVKLIIDVVAYSGVDSTTPILDEAILAEGASAVTAHVTGSVNPSVSGCWIVSVAADRNSAVPTTWTDTETERTDGQNGGGNPVSATVADSGGTVSTGATTRTLTASNANAVATMYAAVLQPAAGGGGGGGFAHGYTLTIG